MISARVIFVDLAQKIQKSFFKLLLHLQILKLNFGAKIQIHRYDTSSCTRIRMLILKLKFGAKIQISLGLNLLAPLAILTLGNF